MASVQIDLPHGRSASIVHNPTPEESSAAAMSKASDRAYAQIRSLILSGELPAGAPLREEHLAETCGVSRTPIRDALRRLEAELFITRTSSQRSLVADWSLDDVEDAFLLRGMLEGLAARRAAARISPAQLERLRAENRAILKAVDRTKPDVAAFLDHNRNFHSLILDAAKSPRLASMLARIIEQPVVWRTAQHYDCAALLRSHSEHEELLAAFARGDGEWAESVMAGHIRRAFHSYADAHRAQHDAFVEAENAADNDVA
jgi:DNA-binding GntR family transcriptional regulator